MGVKHRDFSVDEWPGALNRTYLLQPFADGPTRTGRHLELFIYMGI